tara:strand:- start:101 stop:445 length:345 start_codon:yes stop_codon:yes gene_type:complete
MLQLQNLKASVNEKLILNGLDLEIKTGEVHAIMGPNGSGKSTLANILSGKNGYKVSGSLKFDGKNLQDIPIEKRERLGNSAKEVDITIATIGDSRTGKSEMAEKMEGVLSMSLI